MKGLVFGQSSNGKKNKLSLVNVEVPTNVDNQARKSLDPRVSEMMLRSSLSGI